MAAQRLSRLACGLLALTGSTALNVWESAGSTYYSDTELPGNPDSCCGSQLIGDPAFGVASKICDCDLTAGVCDAKCCCDQDCTEYETMTVFACASNATHSARAGVKMCSDDLVHTNLPRSAVAAGWETETDLDGILCVVHDNSASSGAFYADPTAKGAALSQEEVRTGSGLGAGVGVGVSSRRRTLTLTLTLALARCAPSSTVTAWRRTTSASWGATPTASRVPRASPTRAARATTRTRSPCTVTAASLRAARQAATSSGPRCCPRRHPTLTLTPNT